MYSDVFGFKIHLRKSIYMNRDDQMCTLLKKNLMAMHLLCYKMRN